MKTLVGLGNTLLLALNVSTLGTLAYKGRIWEQTSEKAPATESMEETLELTPAQARAMEIERESFLNEWEQVEAELQSLRERVVEGLRDEGSAPNSLMPLVREISRLQGDLEARAVTQMFEERNLLMPEQRERYFSQMEGRLRQGRRYRGGRGEMGEDLTEPGRTGKGKKGRGKGRRR
jgi:Spy/CpxP family protein refolding chaperone